ncbi:MAG: UDP-N-acetylmuramoyl-L-alanyl-D-glutamate--2,6-diaminopimelate ligase [Betaproteobacteria bacterium]|nr:UDP-N-acetylmuramoyl-L-alanyl-D-glutamate--2,6-diaminopimelate ligase [Betaproteobacteria bacterium]
MARSILADPALRGVAPSRACADSRAMEPGDLFLAYPGQRADGRRHIADAVRRGAAAVVWERQGYAWDETLEVPNVAVDGLQNLSGHLAHRVFGCPSEHMAVIGVTGTNGKTTVSQWIGSALGTLGRPCGVIGTLGSGFPGALVAALNTTPDAVTVHGLLAGFRSQGATAAAMEVSSIGLDQGRVNGVRFAVAVLTNLSRDHLEYHGSMEDYARAKAGLFSLPGVGVAVLNLEDAFGREIARRLKGSGVRRIGYTLDGAATRDSDVDEIVAATSVELTAQGQRVRVRTPGGEASIEARLVGRFNAANLLATLATLLALDLPLEPAVAALHRLTPPRGRMDMQGGEGEPLVVVDYAHTPDALEQALRALRETARVRGGRLVCVFGCGGDRDPGKRPLMGAVAARLADRVLLTSDNPRSEDPDAIIDAIAAGMSAAAARITDRAGAIAAAVGQAQSADVVLVAGKGHEDYQETHGQRRHFSDAEEVARALSLWRRRT